jgi:hypothetical protein
LDEPTSPLDPETIENFLASLRKLAKKGTTIIMVTHKPEDLNYVDNVIFMMVNGYLAYEGSSSALLNRFQTDKIVEIYSKVSDKKNINALIDEYYIDPQSQSYSNNSPQELENDPQKSLINQLYWLIRRYFKIKLSDSYNLTLLLAQPLIIAGLISLIFKEFQLGVLFLMAISAVWFGVSNSAKEIVGELAVFRRERMFNLNIHTYILSKWLVLSTIALIQAIIFVTIIYLKFRIFPVVGLEDIYLRNYGLSILFMVYISVSATLIGLALSAYFDNTEKVMTVVPIALMPQIMFAGVITKIDNLVVELISFFTLGRWGTEGFARVQDNASLNNLDSLENPMGVVKFVPGIVKDQPDSTKMNSPIYDFENLVPEGTSALNILDFYDNQLIQEGSLIGEVFNSFDANISVIMILNIGLYFMIFKFLKKKTAL